MSLICNHFIHSLYVLLGHQAVVDTSIKPASNIVVAFVQAFPVQFNIWHMKSVDCNCLMDLPTPCLLWCSKILPYPLTIRIICRQYSSKRCIWRSPSQWMLQVVASSVLRAVLAWRAEVAQFMAVGRFEEHTARRWTHTCSSITVRYVGTGRNEIIFMRKLIGIG